MKAMRELWNRIPAPLIAVAGIALFVLAGVYYFEVSGLTRPPLGATVVRETILGLTNRDRAANGLAPLTENLLLTRAAQAKADDEAARGYFSHTTPEGNSPLYFMDKAGYKYQNAGENLGVNYASAEDLETGWMNSPEHRANILRGVFTEAGTGVARGEYKGAPAVFAVELFATPLPVRNSAPIVSKAVPAAPAELDVDASYRASLEALISSLTKKVAELRAQLGVASSTK